MNYEDRIVAFIDVLGFRAMVNDTVDAKGNDDQTKIQRIYDAYEVIQDNWRGSSSGLEKTSKKTTIFSDCIVVSVAENEASQVFWTLLEIKHLIMALVYHGILVRGAVVRGKLIHERNVVFGPALVEAYTLESKAALYPRIILDRDLVVAAGQRRAGHHSKKEEIDYVQSLLEKDSDGMYYVDYFFKAESELDEPSYGFPDYISRLGDIIRKGLMGSNHPSNADLKVKYTWMRERYNRMVDQVQSRIPQEDGVNQHSEIFQIYAGLKKIGR